MEASAGVLKSLNKEVGGVENVENVVERLQEGWAKSMRLARCWKNL